MYEYLKPILGDELFAQFVEKMNGATGVTLVNTADGSFVPKAKFDDANDKAKTLNQQIATLTAQLQEAQQQNGDTASLTAQIEKLTADVTARDEQIAKLGLTYRIKDAPARHERAERRCGDATAQDGQHQRAGRQARRPQ